MKQVFLFSKYTLDAFCFISFQVTHMDCAFMIETLVKNESVTAAQRTFRVHISLGRHDPVPTRNTILLWLNNFRATGSA